ncbi:hypothetical protein PTKIN_Ptkin04bG0114200 [Pterospermum kingtungense]
MVETSRLSSIVDQEEGDKWLVAKLITKRPFNWNVMFILFRVVWVLSKPFETVVLDTNLFLFKFASRRDKDKVRVQGLPFNLMPVEVVEHLGNKIGTLKKLDANPTRVGEVLDSIKIANQSFNRRLVAASFGGVKEMVCFDKDGLGRNIVAPVVAKHSTHGGTGSTGLNDNIDSIIVQKVWMDNNVKRIIVGEYIFNDNASSMIDTSKDVGFSPIISSGSALQLNQFDNEQAGQEDATARKLQVVP